MPALAFDKLQKAEFVGFSFPVSEITVVGGLRDHVHEYPHSPGGAPEKLGRKLYEFKLRACFQQGLRGYPNLWPETLASLRIFFEAGRTDDLVIPTLGTVSAYCTSWVETTRPKDNRQGVEVELTFREDDSNAFLVDELITKTTANYQGAVFDLQQTFADQSTRAAQTSAMLDAPDVIMLAPFPAVEIAAFTEILSAANQVLSAIDTVLDIGSAVVDLALGLVALCENLDATSTVLQDPTRYPLLYALQAVWSAAQKLANDAQRQGVTVIHYTVPTVMAITDVSRAIYGSNDHAVDIMACNAIPDVFSIQPGTVIKAYQFTTEGSAAAA